MVADKVPNVKKEDLAGCTDIGNGIIICQKADKSKKPITKKDTHILEDVSKAILVTTVPVITKDEATFIETSFASILIGSLVTGLSIAFGFYIYFLIGYIDMPVIPENPILSAFLVLLGLMLIIAFLSFVQYRVSKALTDTNILERLAVEEDVIGEEFVLKSVDNNMNRDIDSILNRLSEDN